MLVASAGLTSSDLLKAKFESSFLGAIGFFSKTVFNSLAQGVGIVARFRSNDRVPVCREGLEVYGACFDAIEPY